MYSPIVAALVRRGFRKLGAGDPSLILSMFGPGSHFRFPGSSSWSIDTTDKAEITAWFERFAVERPTFIVDDVVAQGPPWAMKVRTRGSDRIERDGQPAYTNQWAQCLTLRWGRVVEDVIYLDTERLATFQPQA